MALKVCPAQEAPAVRLHSFLHNPPPPPATLQKAPPDSWAVGGSSRILGTLQCNSFGSNTTLRCHTAWRTRSIDSVRINGTFSSLSKRPPFFAIIRPRLTLQWLLNIKNKNVQKNPLRVTCVFAFVVCPSALVHNLQTSQFAIRTSAPKNPRSSQGFPLPASSVSALREVGLGLSQTAAAAIDATHISCDFPSSFAPSPLLSPERRVSFQFPRIYSASG